MQGLSLSGSNADEEAFYRWARFPHLKILNVEKMRSILVEAIKPFRCQSASCLLLSMSIIPFPWTVSEDLTISHHVVAACTYPPAQLLRIQCVFLMHCVNQCVFIV